MSDTPTHIRSMHPYAFRSGEWARILSTVGGCYLVEFPDGVTDFWVMDDAAAEYELADELPVETTDA